MPSLSARRKNSRIECGAETQLEHSVCVDACAGCENAKFGLYGTTTAIGADQVRDWPVPKNRILTLCREPIIGHLQNQSDLSRETFQVMVSGQ